MNTHTKEEKAKHEHEFTRRKTTSTVETCRCGAFRHTENNTNPIIEAVTMDNQAKVKNIMRKEDVKTVRDFLEPYQEKATPRPWTFEKHIKHTEGQELKWYGNIIGHYGDNVIRTISCQCRYGTEEENEANASLIVKAVNEYDLDKEAIHNYSQKLLGMQRKNEALLSACRDVEHIISQTPVIQEYFRNTNAWQKLHEAISNATK